MQKTTLEDLLVSSGLKINGGKWCLKSLPLRSITDNYCTENWTQAVHAPNRKQHLMGMSLPPPPTHPDHLFPLKKYPKGICLCRIISGSFAFKIISSLSSPGYVKHAQCLPVFMEKQTVSFTERHCMVDTVHLTISLMTRSLPAADCNQWVILPTVHRWYVHTWVHSA